MQIYFLVFNFFYDGQPVVTFSFRVVRSNWMNRPVLLLIAYTMIFPRSAPISIEIPTSFFAGSMKPMQLPVTFHCVKKLVLNLSFFSYSYGSVLIEDGSNSIISSHKSSVTVSLCDDIILFYAT